MTPLTKEQLDEMAISLEYYGNLHSASQARLRALLDMARAYLDSPCANCKHFGTEEDEESACEDCLESYDPIDERDEAARKAGP
jgi:hypothetical protein